MRKNKVVRLLVMKVILLPIFALAIFFGSSLPAFSAPPVVKTVPWVANNSLIPHSTWSGKQVTLKGTSDVQGANIQYTWDFGDGSAVASGNVADKYVVEAVHTYTGNHGDIFSARLTIQNTTTSESASKVYFVQIMENILDTQVNVAIDEGLWRLHKTMTRTTVDLQDAGNWESGCSYNCSSYQVITPANVTAFFVNGHLETSPDSDPYKETVQRAMRWVFNRLTTVAIGSHTFPAPIGLQNPDSNGNGIGVQVNSQWDPTYEGGMFMDAIVASGTPLALTTTGPVNITGRTYMGVLQDMVDAYAWGQSYSGTYYGGWYYNLAGNSGMSDNSINRWAAIGLIAAEQFGATVPQWVKTANINSVNVTQNASGYFGYTNCNSCNAWGLQALTPAGMVQMAFDGIGRGDTRWDKAENYMRTNFCNTGGAYSAVRDYYYGLLAFAKAMLLHDANGDGIPEPITTLANQPGGANPIDWYSAETANGAQCNGVAKTLVNGQNAAGYWFGHNYSGEQFSFETAWAITMLHRTVNSEVAHTLTVTKTGTGTGTVTINPFGINCGDVCTEDYVMNTVVTLTATPSSGSIFTGWSGDFDCLDGQVIMDVSKTCTAEFSSIPVLKVQKTGNGSGRVVSLYSPGIDCGADCENPYNMGSEIYLEATADPGSYFIGFGGDCDYSGYVIMNGDKTCTAEFSTNPVLTVTKTGNGSGRVISLSAPGIDCGADCENTYNIGNEVYLEAQADPGSYFIGFWGGCDYYGNVYIDGDKTCIVEFSRTPAITHTLTVSTAGAGSGTVTSFPYGIECGADCEEPFNNGTIVTITAAPDISAVFADWSGDADCSDGQITLDSSKNCTASFDALPLQGQTTMVSVASNSAQGNGASYGSSISADGRYVAFSSQSTNLVAGDTNGYWDVFVHDSLTGFTTRVSVASNGAQGNGNSSSFSTPSISSDGRYVTFTSYATNLVAGDTNGKPDVFVHDSQTGVTTRVSIGSNGVQGNGNSFNYYPSISTDGRYVTFTSDATNLVAGDTNAASDVFIHDRQTGVTTRVSAASNGAQGNQGSSASSISADGRYVAFYSHATNLVAGDTNGKDDIFVHDSQTGVTTRVSRASNGVQGNGDSSLPSISADGRYVAFESYAANLVAMNTNGVQVFVHDRQTGVTTIASVDSNGTQGNSFSERSSISADGRYVLFYSYATNLVAGDTNGEVDIFVHDRQSGVTTMVSVNSYGTQGNKESFMPLISADGCYAVFHSYATNLISGDTNAHSDIFVHALPNDGCLQFDIQLNIGWNLISLPILPNDTSIDSCLNTVSGLYNIVWAYDNSEWKMNNPSTPIFNTLEMMEAGKGYWIYMTAPATLTVSGGTPSNAVQLASGWNLVGYNSKTAQPIADALDSIDGKYISVWAFIDGNWQFYAPGNIFNTLETMEPGYGYWINTTEACTWTLP